jgi:hypothetical protein
MKKLILLDRLLMPPCCHPTPVLPANGACREQIRVGTDRRSCRSPFPSLAGRCQRMVRLF